MRVKQLTSESILKEFLVQTRNIHLLSILHIQNSNSYLPLFMSSRQLRLARCGPAGRLPQSSIFPAQSSRLSSRTQYGQGVDILSFLWSLMYFFFLLPFRISLMSLGMGGGGLNRDFG